MTAKNFCYACAGVFLLVAAWTMGARHARADFQPGIGSHVIGAVAFVNERAWALRSDGTVWVSGFDNAWRQQCYPSMTTQLMDQVLFFGGNTVITRDGQYWQAGCDGWEPLFEPIPLPTISVQSSTITDVKGKFRDEEGR